MEEQLGLWDGWGCYAEGVGGWREACDEVDFGDLS